jgi:hypothetical protein
MRNDSPFSKTANNFHISPLLQELMAFTGQSDCYAKSNEFIKKFLSIDVGAAQVFRVTDFYGEQLGKDKDLLGRSMPPLRQEEVLYVGVDGSMVSTRDDGWKEVKLGRLFKSGDCIGPNGDTSWIRHSQYMAHLGDSKTFTGQMDDLIASYGTLGNRLVFLSDGATWIRNWVEDAFPDAVSILDYFHATEHLYEFVNQYHTDKDTGKVWAKEQEALLKESKVGEVIKNIAALPNHKDKGGQKLIDYFENNKHRMDYKAYSAIGVGIIGSGAIESAHRTVIQKRMKLSGQRWTLEGAQNMLNIRTCQMNEKWDKVILIAKNKHLCNKCDIPKT